MSAFLKQYWKGIGAFLGTLFISLGVSATTGDPGLTFAEFLTDLGTTFGVTGTVVLFPANKKEGE